MFISKHAIKRSKQRGLVPKSSNAERVKNFIKTGLKHHCEAVYHNKATGAKVFNTARFTAIVKKNTVVTIYPKGMLKGEDQVV